MTNWVDHERSLAGLPPIITGGMYSWVSRTIACAHNAPEGGIHGHTYKVKAWYRVGHDARLLKNYVNVVCDKLDHTTLPDEIRWGEPLAKHIGEKLPGCIAVEVTRDEEGFGALWVKP